MNFVVGIDGGGTSCRAAVADASGKVLGRAKGGPSNIRSDFDNALANIVDVTRGAFGEAGLDPASIGAASAVLGLAGANVGDYKARLEVALPFRANRIESDALIALEGAIGPGDGAIGVLGTGSVYLARRGEEVRGLGGWGFMVGDQGSGAKLGWDLLQETLLVHDGIHTGSALSDAILTRFGNNPSAVVEFTTNAKPADYGTFAPHVFENAGKDAVADRVLGRALVQVEEALDALKLVDGERLCLLGGLAPLYAVRLPERHRTKLQEPLQDALGGAVSLAARVFGKAG